MRVSERLIVVGETKLWVAEQGAGIPLVLCNGGFGCCDYLGPVAAMVEDIVRAYQWEPRGCGRSSPGGPYDLGTMLTDLEALRVAFGHERWIVGGHSAGADLALAYAVEYPQRMRALMYLSGTGVQDDRQWHVAYEEGKVRRGERLPEFLYPYNPEVNRVGNASWRAYIKQPELLRRIAELDVSVLAVHGGEDIRPDWPVRQLTHLLPNARFELIEGAEHHMELTKPDELRRLLRPFLGAISDASSGR
jgi:proline iminopeptidase